MVRIAILVLSVTIVAAVGQRVRKAEPGQRRTAIRRQARTYAIVLLGTYFGLMALLYVFQDKFLFGPITHADGWVEKWDPAIEDVDLVGINGGRLHGWWRPQADAKWVVIYFHGAAGNVSLTQPVIKMWNKVLGAAVFSMDYPGFGKCDGPPTEAGCCAAALAAYDWLVEKQHIAPRQVLIHGESLGGAMATELAVHRPHHCLFLNSAFASVPAMAQNNFPLFPARYMVRTQFDNLSKLQSFHGPIFIAHGTDDGVVPYWMGQQLYASVPSEHKQFRSLPSKGHELFWEEGEPLFLAMRDFLSTLPAEPEGGSMDGRQ